ncbi:CDP-glycerol glycerophosphotransferase family protein, partial [Methanobrevibacter sp.]
KFLPNFIVNHIDDYISNHIHECYFEITENNNTLNFNLKNKIRFGESYLMIKHRKTGKRILKKITNSKTQLTIEEIREFEEEGVFDIYLRMESQGKTYMKTISFNPQNKDKHILDYDNTMILEAYKNINSDCSLNYYEKLFTVDISDFKQVNNDVLISGVLNFINDCDFDSVELRLNSDKFRIDIPCKFTKSSKNVKFESIINFDLIEDYVYNVFDTIIRIKKDNVILSQSNIKEYNLSNKNISDGEILGYFEDNSADDNPLVCAFYLDYDFDLQSIILNKKDLNKFSRNKKLIYQYNSSHSKKPIVFFDSFHGKFYSGQPKYIYEKMLEIGLDKKYDFVWGYDGDVEIPGNPLYVRYRSPDYMKFLKKAKYLISNIDFPIIKTENQIYLQTTHGTPYKHMGADIASSNKKLRKGRVLVESSTWNYLLSANDYSKKTFKRAFEYEGVIINKGYPSNDIFYQENGEKINELKSRFNIDKDKKVILYAPTFRDFNVDYSHNVSFDLLLDLEKMQNNLSDEYVMILRLHYLLSENLNLTEKLNEFIIDLSDYDDINDLYLVSDILITDYSSAFFDFAHSRKPILFFVPDYEKYMNFRGLYEEVKNDLPGAEITDENILIESIKNIEEYNREFKEKYDMFYDKYCGLGHGTSCEDVINIVFGDGDNE